MTPKIRKKMLDESLLTPRMNEVILSDCEHAWKYTAILAYHCIKCKERLPEELMMFRELKRLYQIIQKGI